MSRIPFGYSGSNWFRSVLSAAVMFTGFSAQTAFAAKSSDKDSRDPMDLPLYKMPAAPIETRWFTFENKDGKKGNGGKERFGRKGAPATALKKGEKLTMADIKGPGTIRRIWCTLFDHSTTAALRGMIVEMYWDGAATPAVRVPLGDFFCHSLGHAVPFQNACFSSPEGRSFNCIIPMPFRKGAKIILVNDSPNDNGVYYEVDATLGDAHDEDTLYFHAAWRRENYTTLRHDMTTLPEVHGRGRFLGCNLGVRLHPDMTNFWWGEGEVKVYMDGDKDHPTLCGTGTEDYIGTGYGQGLFSHMYQGNQYINEPKTAYGFYRFHIPDPVYFRKDIRVTIQVMGGPSYKAMLDALDKQPSLKFMKAGDGSEYYTREELEKNKDWSNVMERIDDHCATAYWYMDKAENGLPDLPPFEERAKDLP